ncbi:RyR domain-containing protein [Eubacterium ruminantium]|uniref:RyR domain-containing protein n=1 Tax=Eubacterium ruminantium TaxID=42322 RepID=A0A1T4L9I1_9FIRM|nr:RyR domain-containing protein [Eubacterium ruminantium]SCW44326.1 RyR domain-containing protein [Eubacterium ruminantium]SDM77162.1 RyR domain-containing protein [Eubacterium ruminantium]SJZ51231.1 RyR domain-containing protein [Eubacterium ruminantium]
MNGGIIAKIRKWIIRLAWIPLVFGVVGYHFIGDIEHGTMGLYESLYATIALYFMNPDSDISNIYVLIAKYSSFLVVADVMFAVFESLHDSLKHIIVSMYNDSTAVYTDNEGWARVITDYWKHSYLAVPEKHVGKLENTRSHIIMFDDDMKNLEIYEHCRDNLKKKHTYIMLNHTDPFLMGKFDDPYLHYFNIYEMMARKYWMENDIFDEVVGNNDTYKIAITSFEETGRAIFRYGFINNVYTSSQKIEYHIWGADKSRALSITKLFEEDRRIENCDSVVFHDNDPIEDMDILKEMSRIIITDIDDTRMLQELLHERYDKNIYYFSDRGVKLGNIYGKKVIPFGELTRILTTQNVKKDRLSLQGMLFNYDYLLRIKNSGIDKEHEHYNEDTDRLDSANRKNLSAPTEGIDKKIEKDIRDAWKELNGFLKGSNIARADHYWIEKKLADEGKADNEEICIIEHNRWCRYHLINGWKYGKEKDREKGTHPLLVPYDELGEDEKMKDDIFDPVIKNEIEKLL